MTLNKQRGRCFVATGYPESLVEDWIDQLDATHLDVLISPLHDQDENPDGTKKKAHWHIMIMWENPTTYRNAKRVFDLIGAVMDPNKVQSPVGYARYLLHLDNPEKHRYDRKDLIILGAVDYDEFIQKSQNTTRVLKEMTDFVNESGVVVFNDLVMYTRQKGLDDWFYMLANTHTRYFQSLVLSNGWKRKNPGLAQSTIVDHETGEIMDLESLADRLREKEAEIKDLKSKLEDYKTDNNNMQNDITYHGRKSIRLEKENAELLEEIKRLKKELD